MIFFQRLSQDKCRTSLQESTSDQFDFNISSAVDEFNLCVCYVNIFPENVYVLIDAV